MTFPRPFGRYTLLATLGKGGMGEVYGARVDDIDKLCVVKVLPRDISHDRESRARFLDEARLVVKLNQRNICSVFDVGVVDGVHYLAMDLVHGRDLRTVWKRCLESTKLDDGLALFIVAEVLDGLDYAHRLSDPVKGPLKIVHRDVSAQNVMVSFEGDVKLIDFGLAASTLKLERTETNVVMGKVAYMPPEQLHGEALDARADVFAAGVVLYELIAGERFYDGVPPLMVSASAASGTFLPKKLDVIEPELRAIVLRAIAPKRDDRIASAAVFAEELRAYSARRGLRGDAAQMRKLMTQLFGEDAEPWQAGSSSTSIASVMQPAAGVTTSNSRSQSADVELTADATAQTERVENRAIEKPRRSRAVLAAAALGIMALAIAIAAIVAIVVVNRPVAVTVAVPPPPVVDVSPPAVPPAPVTPPAPVVPASTEPIEPAPKAAQSEPKPLEAHPKKKRKRLENAMDEAEALRARCPSLPCVRNLVVKDGDVAGFKRAVAKCSEQCE